MSDKDSKLIFEGYRDEILIKEAGPLLAIPFIAPLLAIFFAKAGWTRYIMDISKKYFGVDLDEFSDSFAGAFVRFFDITGISSWASLQKVQEAYDKNPNDWDTNVEWWSQFFGTIPLFGKLLKGITAILPKGPLALNFLRKVFYYVSKDKQMQNIGIVGLKKWYENFKKFKTPKSQALYKQHIEIISQLLVNLYGRAALEVLAESNLPSIIYTEIAALVNQKYSLIEEPKDENEVQKELEANIPKPTGTPAPVVTDNIKEFSLSRNNEGKPVGNLKVNDTFKYDGDENLPAGTYRIVP